MSNNVVNLDRALLTLSAADPGTYTTADQTNEYRRGVVVGVNISALGTSATLTVTIEGKDVASGQYYTLLASTAKAATGFFTLSVYPGITASANVAASAVVPKTWRVKCVGATSTVTATIGASVIA